MPGPFSRQLPFIDALLVAAAGGATEFIRAHFKKHRPATLYHYTTAEGLLGILKGGKLWATHFQHLNDRMECLVFTEAAHAVARQRVGDRKCPTRIAREPTVEETTTFMWELVNTFNSHKQLLEPYVVSLTTLADDLYQWRAYGDAGRGFALGFGTIPMLEAIKAPMPRGMGLPDLGAQVIPVLYQKADQHAFVEAGLNALASELTGHIGAGHLVDDDIGSVAAKAWHSFVMAYSPIFKHQGFASESEWRVIQPVHSAFSEGPLVDVHASRGRLVPFVEVPAPLAALTELWSGPMNSTETVDAVERLLALKKLTGVTCRSSALPFRAV